MSDERRLLSETTMRFLEKYGSVRWVRSHSDEVSAFDAEGWRQGASLGWAAMLVPEDLGGGSVSGEGLLDAVAIAEQLGRALHPAPFLSTNVVASALVRSGSRQARAEFVPRLTAGELVGAWCYTERPGSYDPARLELRVRTVGDGFELHGTKYYVQDGHCAGVLLVTGRDDSGGLTQVVLPRDAAGVTVESMSCMDLTRRVAQVRFDRTILPRSAAIGEPGAASGDVERQLTLALVLQCADSVGAMEPLHEMTIEYAKERFAFGRAIGSFQAVKHRCVEMYRGLVGSRAVTAAAAEAVQQARPDAADLAAIAKAYVGEAASRSAEHAHQIHGGISYTWEHDTHLYSRHAKFNEAMFGSPGWQRERLGRRLGV